MNKEIDETETKISDTDKKIGHKDSTNEEQDEEGMTSFEFYNFF